MASMKREDSGIYHLTVGTEVSAKYRGAFCEAQIKSVKKNVLYKVVSKKTGKSSQLSEESIRGVLKIGSVVEAQFPDQPLWQECSIQSAKDRSSYTVVFDDGDERTLSRGSLCLKGDRHYAKSETLDNLPLTDPENFGTPVLTVKKNRRRRPVDEEYDDDSEDSKTPDRETPKSAKEKKQQDINEQQETSSDDEEEEEDENEKRAKWLQDPLMGKVVIIEPNDKRKHWYPALVVNPLCCERHKELCSSTQILVRSFKTGKFLRVHRSSAKEMTQSNIPPKLDALWKGIVEDAQQWKNSRTVPDKWRSDIKDILYNSENEDDEEQSSGDENTKNRKKNYDKKSTIDDDSKEDEKKNHDFLEVLYKFMEDRDTPINKTPVLGYKDLDLFLLYNLVQKRQAPYATISVKEWKQIYLDLGIPKPNPAAAYNVKTAYQKYLGAYEEYCTSWKHVPLPKKSPPVSATKKKTKTVDKAGKETKSQEQRKIKHKEGGKNKTADLGLEGKQKGRNSPVLNMDSPILANPRRQRRRISESSSASDATVPSTSGKTDTKKTKKATSAKKSEEKFRSPGGPDSEPDDSSRPSAKAEKKESAEKRHAAKNIIDASSSKRIRRNSTSNVSTQYSIGDKLKVKYGQGKTFKLYDAKVLQVKQPEGVGEAIEYYVHYAGWNARHDEWIRQGRIVGLISEDNKVPSSPASGSKTRRPKTPLSARSTYASPKEEIRPSPVLSYQLSSKFYTDEIIPAHLKDDLPEFSVKPRFTSMLKKNLAEDLAKVSPQAPNPQEEIKRATSPILASSNYPRSKRPRTPTNTTDATKGVVKQEVKKELTEEKMMENAVKDKNTESVKQEKKTVEEKGDKAPVEGTSDEKIDKAAKDDRERSVSPSEESTTSSITEASEDNSNDTLSTTPSVHNVRRTSSRRSKSPAYLAESAWYAMTTKRKKTNSSNEKSRSPTPTTTSEKNEEQSPLSKTTNDKDSKVKESSPATCASPLNQSNDDAVSTSKDVAVTTTPVSSPKPSGKLKGVRSKKKSQDKTESETTLKDEIEPSSDKDKVKEEQTPRTEYDNFDEEAPSIALEKHHDTDNTVPEQHDTESNKDETNKSTTNTQDLHKVTEKKKDSPKKTTRRKIQKGKGLEKEEDDNKKEAVQESENSEKKSQEVDDIVMSEVKTEAEQMEVVETPIASNNPGNANDEMRHSPGGLSPHPHNAPSSSKVLLENTPPTTPEQSPNYTSEDQDIEPGKNSPTLDSDAMDIPEEQKDSGGNSSSSGCEHHTADIVLKQESETQEDDKNTKEEEIPSPPPAKKKRGRSRKRTNTKERGSRRSSYTNEQDTESEEEHDNETGETNRKRHESGSRCRPRKKRTKARPEPPSAPPPLPREELENMSQDERIALLQSRMAEMRKVYHQLKQEVANIDRKRKRAKRREREAAEAAQLLSSSKRGSSPVTASKGTASKPEATSTVVDGQASVVEGKATQEESG